MKKEREREREPDSMGHPNLRFWGKGLCCLSVPVAFYQINLFMELSFQVRAPVSPVILEVESRVHRWVEKEGEEERGRERGRERGPLRR